MEAIRFLGPENCTLSIVEGNSPDGTAEVLEALQPELTKLGVRTYFVLRNTIDPLADGSDRFSSLAELRNMALAPLRVERQRYTDATVVFVNDVALCLEDILELVYQRRYQGADMACAMDWVSNDPPVFYDVYVARAINGDTFFEIPPGVSWDRATYLFWNEPIAQSRFEKHQSFQVFACWNGAVAFAARPVVEGKVSFRASRRDKGECHHGEPQLFCKDLWFQGHGKIMVVPTVNLEYSVKGATIVKNAKGYVSQLLEKGETDAKIEWRPPPENVKCMPTFDQQSWRPWNETLP